MKKSILILLFLIAHYSYGQNVPLTKENLFKKFKESIKQNSKNSITTNSNPWVICNDDSLYYKSDTLKLTPHSNNYPDCKCSCFIDWTFYKKGAFILTKEFINEPRQISVAQDWYVIKLLEKNKDLILETYNQNKVIEQFKVLSINPNIILLRIKVNH